MSSELVKPSVIPEQVDYQVHKEYAPRYRFTRLSINNQGSDNFTISGSAQQMIEFRIPSGCYNLSKSVLCFSLATGGEGTSNFVWMYVDVASLASQVQLGNASGLYVMDLQFAQNYSKIMRRIATEMEDYLDNDNLSLLYKSDLPKEENLRAEPINVQALNPYNLPANSSYFGGVVDLVEPKHLEVAIGQTAGTADMTKYFQLPLSAYKNTILAVDKDLYSHEELYLRLNVGANTKMAYYGTSQSNPSTGATALATAVTIGRMYLFLAVEQNEVLVNSLRAKYMAGGLKLQIPYTVGFRNATASGTSSNINIQVNKAYGKRLKHIVHSVFNTTENINLAYDNSNWNGSKVTYFMTYVNSKPLFDSNIYCYQAGSSSLPSSSVGNEDYRENKKHLKKTTVSNGADYQCNWFHMDAFDADSKSAIVPCDNNECGLDMNLPEYQNLTWQFSATTASAAYNHYTFFTFLKDILLSPVGLQILN